MASGRPRSCSALRPLGLRAGLPRVQGVANTAHPQDGRGGRRLSNRRLTLLRHRRATVARGVPPQGPLRSPRSHSTTAAASAMVRQGLALRRRTLYDRLRAIAGYDYTRRPDATLILTPSVWEERPTRFCINLNLQTASSPWRPGTLSKVGTFASGANSRGSAARTTR